MGSTPTDVLLLDGVAAIVKDLAEFTPIRALFRTRITRWRKKNAENVAKRRKAEAELIAFARQRPNTANPAEKEWPLRRIHSSDFSSSELVPIPQELYDKVQDLEDPDRYHLLRALDDKRDWTPTESFTMLAEIHDAAYQEGRIGYADEYLVSVADAATILKDGISQVAVERLATLVEKSLDRINSQSDANAKNGSGETLQQIIKRSRKKLEDLVTLSRQHFVTHTDLKSVQDAIEKLQIDVKSSLMIRKPAAAGSLLDSVVLEFAKATERVPDEYKEQGLECGPLEGNKTALAKAVTRNPKAKPEDLNKHHGGKVFVREISKRKLEVFFRSFREFNAAKKPLTPANSE